MLCIWTQEAIGARQVNSWSSGSTTSQVEDLDLDSSRKEGPRSQWVKCVPLIWSYLVLIWSWSGLVCLVSPLSMGLWVSLIWLLPVRWKMLILSEGWQSSSSSSSSPSTDLLASENLAQAVIIVILDVVIVCSNVLIIATLVTGSSGQLISKIRFFMLIFSIIVSILIDYMYD